MRKRNTPFCYIPALAKHQDRFFLVRLVIGMGRFCWFRQRGRTLPEADNYAGRLIEWFATAKQVGYTHFLLALWETFCFDVVRMVPLVQRREGHFQRQIGPQGWVNSFPVFIIRNRDKGLGWLGSSHAPPPPWNYPGTPGWRGCSSLSAIRVPEAVLKPPVYRTC